MKKFPPHRGAAGSALVSVLIFATVLAYLSSLLLQIVFSHSTLFGQTQGRHRAQKAAEAAFYNMENCLNMNWDGQSGTLSTTSQTCLNSIATLTIDGRSYSFSSSNVSISGYDPATIRITIPNAY